MEYQIKSLTLKNMTFKPIISKIISELYDNFNKKEFDKEIYIPKEFEEFVKLIYKLHNQDNPKINYIDIENYYIKENNNDIVISYSGGLDSLYIALKYKEMGKKVHLFHIRGLNTFSAAYEYKKTIEVAKKYNFDLIVINCIKVNKKSEYHQYWQENSIKNQFIQSLIADYCIQNGYSYMTTGYENKLRYYDAIVGYNLTDTIEITSLFDNILKNIVKGLNIKYILNKVKKTDKLEYLSKNNSLMNYFSCTDQVRFVNMHRNMCENKYNFNIPIYGCGLCRKCICHLIALDKIGIEKLPKSYIDDSMNKLKTKFSKEAISFLKELND